MSVELLVQPQLAVMCAGCGAGFSVDRAGRVWPDELVSPQQTLPPPLPPAARIRQLATVSLKQVRSAPRETAQVEERGATADEATSAAYMVTRDGARPEQKRRRVVVVTRTPRKRTVRARIVSLPANFGRDDGAVPRPPSVGEPVAMPVAEPVADAPPRGVPLVLAALLALAIVVGLAVMFSGGLQLLGEALTPAASEGPPDPPLVAEVVEVDAAPPVRPKPKPKPKPEPKPEAEAAVAAPDVELLQVRVDRLAMFREARAVVVHGEVDNAGVAPRKDIRLRVVLTDDEGVMVSQRLVWCCQTLTETEALAAAGDPLHPHFGAVSTATLGPGRTRRFAVLFSMLDEVEFEANLQGEATVMWSKPVTEK